MSLFHNNILGGAAGASEPLYAEDVFSNYLYAGNGGTSLSINNGIDLSDEGGLVWIKARSANTDHFLFDTERGPNRSLSSNDTSSEDVKGAADGLTSFNNNGFTVGGVPPGVNYTQDYASWSFRKAPGFFDVVKYAGDGTSTNQVAHNLGSTPGMIIVKKLDSNVANFGWYVWHRSLSAGDHLLLNSDNNTASGGFFSAVTSTYFTPINNAAMNAQGSNYVAYFFAHDDAQFGRNGDESIIKCGTYTGNQQARGPKIVLGWEPQWVLTKKLDGAINTHWSIFDHTRGLTQANLQDKFLYPSDNLVDQIGEYMSVQGNGFQPTGAVDLVNGSNHDYIYVAIRRPHKPPTNAAEVFTISTAGLGASFSTGRDVDWVITTNSPGVRYVGSRHLGNDRWLRTDDDAGAGGVNNGNYWEFDNSESFIQNQILSTANPINYAFSRAPGFFDIVSYEGTGVATAFNHNLAAVPEMMLVKNQSASARPWAIYHSAIGETKSIPLGQGTPIDSIQYWNDTAPTSTQFTVGNGPETNESTEPIAVYLFATLAGISKVGTYSGSNSTKNIDCGFSSGARFVLIKRTDTNGDWYVFDTTRGIVSGNDPYFQLNNTLADNTSNDYIDPLSSGFALTGGNPDVNTSGGTYIFLAIA